MALQLSLLVILRRAGFRWQRRLRQVLALLDDGKAAAELGEAFVLVEEAEVAMDMLLQPEEAAHG